MQLEDDDIREFQALWQEEFGETIPPAFARERGSQLLELYTLLAQEPGRPPPESAPPHPFSLPP